MRHSMFTCLCCLAVCVLGVGSVHAAPLHRTGLVYEDLGRTEPAREVIQVAVAPGARYHLDMPRVDLSDQVPPVGNQGGQGSCASWACAYYHRSQLEFVERRWNLTDPRHQFSPAFCYNQVNGGADRGSGFSDNFGLMCEQGCASMADSPYNDRDPLSWPSEQAYINGIPYRCKDWAWAYVRDSSGLALVRQLLNNGFTSALGIWVWGNFDEIGRFNNIYCAADRFGTNRGGHGVTIVGYDDTLTTNDGPGAFKLVNSWGTGWGAQGFFWMSYVAVLNSFLSQQVIGWMTDTIGYVPQMLGRVRISHPARDRVGITLVVGPREVPLWFRDFRTWRHPHVDQPFPATNMVFDMTEGADYIANLDTDSTFVCCYDDEPDGKEGSLRYYSAQYVPWGNIIRSRDTPLSIPDTWQMVYALARIKRYDPDVGIIEGPTPTGVVDSGRSVVPQAKVRNFGQAPASFPVELRIGPTWRDTQSVVGLGLGDTVRLSFRTWTAPARGVFHTRCTTALPGDQYADNDYSDDSVFVRVRDVALTEITSPPDTVDTGAFVLPQVRVRNVGTQSETLRAVFRIPAESYLRGAQRTVAPGTETLMTFPGWKPRIPGTHVACCTLNITGDMNPANNAMSKEVTVLPGAGVAEPGPTVPAAFALEPPCPNPFRGSVLLSFALPGPAEVALDVYDATGSLVRHLVQARHPAGRYRLTWDGRDLAGRSVPPGIYYCRLDADRASTTARLLKLE